MCVADAMNTAHGFVWIKKKKKKFFIIYILFSFIHSVHSVAEIERPQSESLFNGPSALLHAFGIWGVLSLELSRVCVKYKNTRQPLGP